MITSPAEQEIVEAELAIEFELAINQTALIQSEGLGVLFLNVTEDSRCPVDVTCIQSGKATIVLGLSRNDQSPEEMILSTSLEENEAPFDPYVVRLVGVEPAPISTLNIDISDYRIRLLISRQ